MLYIVLIGAGWLASGMFVSLSIDSLFYISLTRVLGRHDLICHPRSIIRRYRFSIFFYVMCIIFLLCLVVNKWSWIHGVSFAVGMLLWMFSRKDLNTPNTLKQYVIHNRYYFENKDMYDLVNSDVFHAMWRKNSALHEIPMLWTLKDLHNLGRLGSEEWDDYTHSLSETAIGREEQSKSVIEDGEQPTYKVQSDRFHENLNAIIKPYAEVMREVYFDVDEISYIEHLPYPKPVILAAVKVYYAYFFLQGDDDSCKFLRQSFLAAASFQSVCEEDKVVLEGFFGKAKKKSDMNKGKTDSEFSENFESALRLLSNYKDKSNQEMDKYWDELATIDQYLSGLRSDRKTVEVLSEPVSFYLFAAEHHPSLVETINSIQ